MYNGKINSQILWKGTMKTTINTPDYLMQSIYCNYCGEWLGSINVNYLEERLSVPRHCPWCLSCGEATLVSQQQLDQQLPEAKQS